MKPPLAPGEAVVLLRVADVQQADGCLVAVDAQGGKLVWTRLACSRELAWAAACERAVAASIEIAA